MIGRAGLLAGMLVAAAACGDDGSGMGAEPPFPTDYAASYQEVRDCRRSGDHELHHIRILADPGSAPAYLGRDAGFEPGAVVVKEEYDFADDSCSGEILRWTAMVRLPEGSSPDTLDWAWYDLDADGQIVSEDQPSCIGCHELCTAETGGYLSTCAEP